ncbi:hypothetical protein [Nocardia caishijiensis]|uniref:Uncharacterized protein n=1 Tax=Nocardia caishijiensis TaxID=184756 RepID=A0ABQ6YM20_9NOCA|nr:hypothetical protein [Nocardia caishijiensis]KAF0846827.1 hypothetical protein FNL39_104249 [Nocardia caishijiensis]
MSEMLWVAVPSGRDGAELSVRVLVVPRLDEGTLVDFGLADWPSLLNDQTGFELRVRTDTGERVVASAPRLVARARSELWHEFFGGDAGFVRQWEDRTVGPPQVSDTSATATKVAATLRTVTRVGAERPPEETEAAVREQLATWHGTATAPVPDDNEPPPPVVADFHRTVANLREHPAVLLELGLVFELRCAATDLGEGTALLSVRCVDPPFLRNLVTAPWTRYELTATGFRPAPDPSASSGIRAGMLDLSDSVSLTDPSAPAASRRWAIATFDIDGGADGFRQAAHDFAANTPADPVLPPVRSSGITLLQPGRGREYLARSGASTRRARDLGDVVFTAEDLVLGYRVDIRREGTPWLSVCARDAGYRVNGVDIVAGREEGHVKPFAAVRGADGQLRADEAVLRWDGWSLALPSPNLRGDTTGPARNPAQPLPFDFAWDYTVPPRSMPALRFADLYQVRVRIADMAGGGLTTAELDDATVASAAVSYLRHDPVPPPQVHGPAALATGATVTRLVIRSDAGRSVADLHAENPEYPVRDSRVLRAPTAALSLVEQHRMLDERTDEESFQLAQRAMDTDGSGAGLPDPVASGVRAQARFGEAGLVATIGDHSAWSPAWPHYGAKTVELHDSPGAEPITVRWNGDVLSIGLAKGKQARIELSSTLDGELSNHLAISDALAGGAGEPTISPDSTKLGRNPAVTPPVRIEVVHAVKHPLREPVWELPDEAVHRQPGDPTALLTPMFTDAGLDPHSTGRLGVSAAWTDVTDTGTSAATALTPRTLAAVHSQVIDPGHMPSMRFRHEFGDTRHRTVTYTLEAASRYRQYFAATDPDSDFALTRPQTPVVIVSSARPAAPVVLGVVPAFATRVVRTGADRLEFSRDSGRIRVEVARPWYETGAGEQLGVVLAPDADPTPTVAATVSRAGRDPLFGTPDLPSFPQAEWFPSAVEPVDVVVPELGEFVAVAPHEVSPGTDRWFADVQLAVPREQQSYHPFVRLAVARFQRHSLDGMYLSPIVITDAVPLLPHRNVVVERSGDQLRVAVGGTSPNPLNRLELRLESCPAGSVPESVDLVVDDPAEQQGLPVWRPVGAVVERAEDGAVAPLTMPPTADHLRLRLCETEKLTGQQAPDLPAELRLRTVFVATIVLPVEWYRA